MALYIRPIYIGKKTKSKKPGFFVVPFTLPEKPITFRFFGTKSACAKKPESHTGVLVSGAHARLLSTFDRTRVVRITSRAAVGWFRWKSRITWPKTRIIPCDIGAGVYIGKKNPEKPAEFQKILLRRWVFRFGFFAVFRGSCLATSHKNPNVRKIRVFLCKCKRLLCGIYFKNFVFLPFLPNTKHSVYMKAGLQDYIMTVTAIITISFSIINM